MKKIFIGTSGWSYPHWRGTFYPDHLKVRDQFNYYVSKFNSVEINNTFYRLPKKETFVQWRNNSPDNFLFVLKASRFITHMKKLQDPVDSVSLFLDHAVALEKKIGPILFQLPPFLLVNRLLLENFLSKLPTTFR